jgi:4a-hydroxytetrahydrobiopterin dehydratase
MPEVAPLTHNEVLARLTRLPGWTLDSGRIVQEFKFEDFVAAMHFVNAVAALAEAAGHHPDIDIRYNRVFLALVSHDAGGITENDCSMASRISSISN